MQDKELWEQEKRNRKLNEANEKIEKKEAKRIEEAQEKRRKRNLKLRRLAGKRREKREQEKRLQPIREQSRKRKEYLRGLSNPPKRPVLEEVGNAVTHGIGAILAIVALVCMLMKSDTPLKVTASWVYGMCMFIMMLMSCLYHSFKSGSKVKRIWRRFDYSSIYLLIGGTFAPLYLVYWGNTLGIVLFIIQWCLIALGITMVCIFGPGRFKWFHYTMYFAIGWSGLIFIPDWIKNNPNLLWMILGGGVVYTLGMIPFAKKSIKSAHFIWHFFVLAGAAVQFLGILLFAY